MVWRSRVCFYRQSTILNMRALCNGEAKIQYKCNMLYRKGKTEGELECIACEIR